MKGLGRARRAALIVLGSLTASACAFIDRFEDVKPDPPLPPGAGGGLSAVAGSGGGPFTSAGHGGASDTASSASSGNASGTSSGDMATVSSSSVGGGSQACTPSKVALCYSGPSGTLGTGNCTTGTKTCALDGSGYGPCLGQVLPAFEACVTEADENCDGVGCVGDYAAASVLGDSAAQQGSAIAAFSDVAALTGAAGGAVNFGSGVTLELGAPTIADAFLFKVDSALAPLWSHRFSDSRGNGVAFAPKSGDVVLVGSAQGDVDFGGGTLPAPNPAKQDAFVARFDPTGAHLGSRRYGDGAGDQSATAVAVSADGSAIVAGVLEGTLDCKNGTTLASKGGSDIFLARVSPDGAMLWCRSFGDTAEQQATGVAVTTAGRIVLVGWFAGALDFGGPVLEATGQVDPFIAAFDLTGKHLTSRSFDAQGYGKATSVAVDGAGDAVMAGFFKGQLRITGVQKIHTMGDDEDAFVIKLGPAGEVLWVRRFGDVADQRAQSVAVDAGGNVLLTGTFAESLGFWPLAVALASAGGFDGFVAKLDPSGKGLWARAFGDAIDQSGASVAADSLGAVWFTGALAGSADFGGGVRSSAGATDIFLTKLTP